MNRMKNRYYTLIFGLLVVFMWISLKLSSRDTSCLNPIPYSCTIISASIGDKVLFGNNEDYNNPNTCYWTEPGDSESYGCLYLGFENDQLQGGINEKGLCFDANGLPGTALNQHSELPCPPMAPPPYEKYTLWAPVTILREAATVEEAIVIASKYQRRNWDRKSGIMSYQVHFADAQGDAVIISAGTDGELAFTRKKSGDRYLVSTNFNRANPDYAITYPCWRFNKATEILNKIKTEDVLTVESFKAILDSIHLEEPNSHTLYSNIFDLQNGIMYLYYWHQFDEVVELNINEEINRGKILVYLRDLFSERTIKNAEIASQNYK